MPAVSNRGVELEFGTEGGAGQGEHRAAVVRRWPRRARGRTVPVGAHDHDVAGGAEVGLQVVTGRPVAASVKVGAQVAVTAAGSPIARHRRARPDAVDDGGCPDVGAGRPAPARGATPATVTWSGQHVGHLALPAELGVGDVAARGREGRSSTGELPGSAGGLGVDVREGAEVGAGDDEVRPHLVGAGEVVDRARRSRCRASVTVSRRRHARR